MMRGISYFYVDNIDAAWADLDLAKSLDVDGEYPDIDLYRGWLLQETGDDEAALEAFQSYLEVYPDDALALELLGESLFFLERDDEALQAFSQALELADPESDPYTVADARFYRGVTYYYQGDYESALDDLNEAASAYEDDAWTYAYRSEVNHELGDTEAAYEDMQHAFELDPSEPTFQDIAQENGFDLSEFDIDQSGEGDADQDDADVSGEDNGSAQDDGTGLEGDAQPTEDASQTEGDGTGLEGDAPPTDDGSSIDDGSAATGYNVSARDDKALRLKPALRQDASRDALRSRSDNSVRSRSRGEDRGSTRGSTRITAK